MSKNKRVVRVAWNKGKVCPSISLARKRFKARCGYINSPETRKKMRCAKLGKPSGRKGKKHSEESKKKMNVSHKGCVPWNKGRPWHPAMQERLRTAQLGKVPWNKGLKGFGIWNRDAVRSEETKEKLRRARLKQVLPTRDTSIERKVQEALKEKGIRFETHYPILGQPDIFIKPNIAVFCDGDYWHRLPKSLKRDKEVNDGLRSQGYVVIRLWENEINDDLGVCLSKIKQYV